MKRARPTLRCLTEDLGEKLPPLSIPLDTIQHPLVVKAASQFTVPHGHDRILQLDDRIWWKVKIQRWRGAVHTDGDRPWLGAAGWRQQGAPEDFYVDLGKQCEKARKDYNRESRASLTTNTLTDWMLPTERDQKRLVAEQKTAAAEEYREVVPQLVRDAILTGEEQQAEVSGYSIAVVVGGEPADSAYVGIVITGRVNVRDHAVILRQVPGADPTAWFPDAMPHRGVRAGEVVWSNFLDVDFLNGVLAGE